MKRILIILGVIAAVLGVVFVVLIRQTKSYSPAATATHHQNGLDIRVDYCQPAKKGRVIFGGLLPYGQVWRTGANEATEISFSQPVLFAGKPVKAGKYTLFTIPDPKRWTVILNKETGQWGLSHNESEDLLRVEVPPVPQPDVTELFTIAFHEAGNGSEMQLVWDQTKVAVPIRPQ
ncbi:MAG: DUF2911 domain-containing protein [Ferruginibacter sp.]|nr:DUF2911 domain-containing protein [Cytophagales bacterium]